MVVTCPHCHANYKLATTIRNAVLVCHRCGAEFNSSGETANMQDEAPRQQPQMPSLFDWKPPAGETPASVTQQRDETMVSGEFSPGQLPHFIAPGEPIPLRKEQMIGNSGKPPAPAERPVATAPAEQNASPAGNAAANPAAAIEQPTASSKPEIAPPMRRKTRIWPWLLFILLAGGGSGIWFKHEAWLQDLWVRSMLVNLQVPLSIRASDWRIPPESVHSQWLTRDDDSRVLVIEGRVENRLSAELMPPDIEVQLFDHPDARKPASILFMPITEPPSLPALRKSPFAAPARDSVPVVSLGERDFVLVLEKLPAGIRDFALTPAPPR